MRHLLIVTGFMIIVWACGTESKTDERTQIGPKGEDGTSCTITQFDDGAEIKCPDGTSVEIFNGVDGKRGKTGKAGEDGVDGVDGKSVTGQDPIYIGYYCSRVVLKINKKFYVNHGQLILLTDSWTTISNSCEIRLNKGKVETK